MDCRQPQLRGTRYWQRCALSNLGNGPSRHWLGVFRLCDCSSGCRQTRLKGRFKWKALRKRNRRGTRGKFRVEQAAIGIRGRAYCSCDRWRLNGIGEGGGTHAENPHAKQCAQGESEGARNGSRKNSPGQTTALAWNKIKTPIVCHSSRYRAHCNSWLHSANIVGGVGRRDQSQQCAGSVTSLAKRGQRKLRRFAGAPLRRFLAKCRSRYHYSIWDKRRARLTGKTDGSVRKRPAMGRETCVAVAHYRRRELEGLPRRLTSASGRGANVGFWRGLAVPGPARFLRPLFSIRAAAFEPRIKHCGRIR
jgi:hypothetical protein